MKQQLNSLAVLPILALSLVTGCGDLNSSNQNASEVIKIQASRLHAESPLLTDFTSATGIAVELVEERKDADLAQVIDTGNIYRQQAEGDFQSITSTKLKERLPQHLADLDQGWMGYAVRSRIIYYNPDKISHPPTQYSELADSRFEGQLCLGAGTSLYNTSMVAAILGHEGQEATQQWIEGLMNNLAEPAGGRDSELLARVAEDNACHLTLANHYYYARFALSEDPDLQSIAAQVRPIWPEQDGRGSLQNVAAFALLKSASNPELATRFLEYVASDAAQQQIADGIFLPVIELNKPAVAQELMGRAKLDQQSLTEVTQRVQEAKTLIKQMGWE